jgi:hypothetical protein
MDEPLEGACESTALGVRVTHLPFDPWRPSTTPTSSASIRWRASRGGAIGDPAGWWRGDLETATVGWGGFADYHVRSTPPPQVDVSLDAASPDEVVLAFMLSVLPTVLPLFGLEPFHGSAIRVGDGAAVFLGGRGGGKSSTAAALHSMGYQVMTDDACALDDEGRLWPGAPLVSPRDELAEQRVVGSYNRKLLRDVGDTGSTPALVRRVFVLQPEPGSVLRVAALPRADAFLQVIGNSRHPHFLAEVRQARRFRLAARLSELGVHAIRYDPGRHSFLDVAAEVTRSPGLHGAA